MQWKPIPSFPGYEVSEFGDVKRVVRVRGGPAGRVLKPFIRADGYPMYMLRVDGRTVHRKAHQLVVEAFIGPAPFPKSEVRHWPDPTKSNNHYTNLRWGTSRDNKQDAIAHGTFPMGERHRNARLTERDVMAIRARYAAGETQRAIGADYDMRQNNISRIVNGVRWARVGP
jgi:hypothetical protein